MRPGKVGFETDELGSEKRSKTGGKRRITAKISKRICAIQTEMGRLTKFFTKFSAIFL